MGHRLHGGVAVHFHFFHGLYGDFRTLPHGSETQFESGLVLFHIHLQDGRVLR